jgi:O-antigen ligase
LGFAAFSAGGVTEPAWGICMVGICAVSLLISIPTRRGNPAPPLGRLLNVVLILLPCYVALQLLPLPLAWLKTVSPARAELQDALLRFGLGAPTAPISAAPSLTLAHLLRLLSYICFFLIARALAARFPKSLWLTSLPVVLPGSAEAALGLWQYFHGASSATGTYVNPNHYSCFLQMALPFSLALAIIAIRRRRGTDTLSLPRIFLGCLLAGCAALISLGALYSLSRMGVAGLVASLLVLISLAEARALSRRLRGTLAATAALTLAGFVYVSAPSALLERLAGPGHGDPLTADARLQIWKDTLRMAADYRYLGSGLGTFASVFQKYSQAPSLLLIDFAHNDYLQLLAELGLIGFTLTAVGGLAVLARVVRAALTGPTTATRLLAAAGAASLVAIMLDSSVDFDFYIPANALLAAWIAGIGTTVGASINDRDRRASSSQPA